MQKYTDPGYDALDAETTARLGLPDGLLPAIRTRGERSNADQVSEDGARSVYQIIPATRQAAIKKWGVDPYLSPENASLVAGYLLKDSLERNKGDVAATVGEYHGGTDRAAWGPRTKSYLNRVLTGLPAAAHASEAAPTGRRLSQELATQQEAVPSIAKVYDAYAAGRMDTADAAEFEADVAAGRVLLPRGAKIKAAPAADPIQGVLGAYVDGKMTPDEKAEFEGDVAAGRVKLPAGVDLKAGPASMIPGQSADAPKGTGNEEMTLGQKLKEAGKIAIESTLGAIAPGMQGSSTKAATETAMGVGSGLVGGTAGMVAGTIGGTAGAVLSGQYGTQQGVQGVEQAAAQGADTLTYHPRMSAAQQATETIGKGMQAVLPVMPLTGEMAMAGRAAASAAPAVAGEVRAGAATAQQTVKAKVQEAAARKAAAQPAAQPTPGTMGSVGAAGTDIATLRRTAAQDLPVPIELTKGQAERTFEQQRFEREMAKDPVKGQALRERFEDQNARAIRNFDVFVDETGAQKVDPVAVGDAVTSALRERAAADKARIRVAYKNAEKAGAMEAPVSLENVVAYLNEAAPDAATAPLLTTVRSWAKKLGLAEEAPDGTLVPAGGRSGSSLMNDRQGGGAVNLKTAETFRQAINRNTDFEPTNVRQATIIKGLIDEATEGLGGELYRQARMQRRQYAERYENFGLARDLLNNKRGMSDAIVPAEKVFQKAILSAPMADVKQIGRLLKSGGEPGRQAWAELQGAALRHIKEEATKNTARDSLGNPIVSVAGLDGAVKQLDSAGKLDYMFGKKGSEQIRAINDLAKDIYTSPPGAVNHSNTASVILAALDIATSGLVGMPAPIFSGLRILTTHVKDRQIQKRIREALGIEEPAKKVKAPVSIVPKSVQATRAPESRTVH